MPFVKVDPGRAATEHTSQRLPIFVWYLGGAVEFEHVACSVVAANRAPRLQRHARMAADGEVELDDGRGIPERGSEVTIALPANCRLGS